MRSVFGLISLVLFLVRLAYVLPAFYRWARELIGAAFSEPPAPRAAPVPRPVDDNPDH